MAPVSDRLDAKHLVVVPHGPLHYLPFHALLDGGNALIDRFRITYAPSAAVLHITQQKPTRDRLVDLGGRSWLIHIATHGRFRRDNPMFSGIELGDSRLTLYDLYDLRLECELVALSGCGTALSAVEEGDELIGLTRGLLYAGARSVLGSLWEVHDRSTTDFMAAFYRHLTAGADRAESLQRAMHELRADRPEPYYWAPFVLAGAWS